MSRINPQLIGSNKTEKDSYNFTQFEYQNENKDELWITPIPEFLSFDYMRAILYIFDKKNIDKLPYETIREIFVKNKVPTFTGLVMQGINILEAQYAIKKIRKSQTLYIERY